MDSAKKQALVTKLEEVEKRYDFYTNLYRRYSSDLLKLCIYVRKLTSNKKVRDYLEGKFPEALGRFENILSETERANSS